jgi:hypothetical protein
MDNRVDELLHDVEEQLKWERFEKIWKDYGVFFIAGILAIILGVAGYVYWDYASLKNQEELSEKYTSAITLLGKDQQTEAIEKLKVLSEDSSSYGMMARFVNASVLVDNPQTRPQAVAIYRDIIANKSIDRKYRNLAIVFLAMAEMDSGDTKELAKLLQETSTGINMWPDTTAELTALVALKNGEIEQARSIFEELKKSEHASQGVQLRAKAMLQTLPPTK